MASKFLVTDIVDPVKAPITEIGLRHINAMSQGVGDALVKALVGTYTTNDLIVSSGCVVTVLSGSVPGTGTASLSAGYVYRNGEVFAVDAIASIATTANTLVWVADDELRDSVQTKFSDANDYDFLRVAKLKLQAGASGSGLNDFDAATVWTLSEQRNADIQSYQTGWSNARGCKFRELPFGDIEFTLHIAITAGGTTSVGSTPSWAQPAFSKRYYIGDYNGSDGASELLILSIAATTGAITILKQSDGTKPANRADFYTTLRYNKFS